MGLPGCLTELDTYVYLLKLVFELSCIVSSKILSVWFCTTNVRCSNNSFMAARIWTFFQSGITGIYLSDIVVNPF